VLWRHIDRKDVRPKWYLNGFPKSGLHLLELYLQPAAMPMPPTYTNPNTWVGSFHFNSWTNQWDTSERILYEMAKLANGHYYKGHLGHRPEIEQWLYYSSTAMVFIYRDLRDVAVSQAHHALSPDDTRHKHPAKAAYRAIREKDGFASVLGAVIEGMGPFPGVVERWRQYAPWLDVPWVYKARFEDLVGDDRQRWAEEILHYGMERTIGLLPKGTLRINDGELVKGAEAMVESSGHTEQSPTFRRGKVGGWEDVFTEEHVALWKANDPDNWLMRLEYEEDDDWGLPEQDDDGDGEIMCRGSDAPKDGD